MQAVSQPFASRRFMSSGSCLVSFQEKIKKKRNEKGIRVWAGDGVGRVGFALALFEFYFRG